VRASSATCHSSTATAVKAAGAHAAATTHPAAATTAAGVRRVDRKRQRKYRRDCNRANVLECWH
jgi:hypothetical protein